MDTIETSELVQCPYDKAHVIVKSRFQVHLARCRRNHPLVPKVVCPFNVTHLLNKPEFEWHITSCPDRASFENYKYRDATSTKPTEPPKIPQELVCSEDWDNEPDVPSYDPTRYTEKAPVLRCVRGAKPSDRKKFRESEHARLTKLGSMDDRKPLSNKS